jgi:hypothetical protein
MVDPEVFEAAREILSEELEKAYEGVFVVPPVEVVPGLWMMWPDQRVEVILEETRNWSYGMPGAGTGVLQAHVHWPYGHHERIKPKKGRQLGRKELRKAAKTALDISRVWAAHYRVESVESQEAWLRGKSVFEGLPEDVKENIWEERALTFSDHQAKWDRLWNAIYDAVGWVCPGTLEWLPDYEDLLVVSDENRETALNAVLQALDHWAVRKGFLRYEADPRTPRWVVEG